MASPGLDMGASARQDKRVSHPPATGAGAVYKGKDVYAMNVRTYAHRVSAIAAMVIIVAMFTAACASSPVQKAQQVSVDVHAALAAIQDAETVLNDTHAVAAWTPEKHRQFNAALVPALQAGRALNEGVRVIPVSPAAKADLATVSDTLTKLDAIVADTLPADHKVALAIHAATQAVLQLLPLFLQ